MLVTELACIEPILDYGKVGTKISLDLFNNYAI